jgi:hypothetical protein
MEVTGVESMRCFGESLSEDIGTVVRIKIKILE